MMNYMNSLHEMVNRAERESAEQFYSTPLLGIPSLISQKDLEILIGICESWYKDLSVVGKIFLDSYLLYLTKESEYILKIIDLVTESEVDKSVANFIFCQLKSMIFRFPELGSVKVHVELTKLLEKIVDSFAQSIGEEELCYIPEEERNPELVYVITSQFLGLKHGPTKTALDRCKVLAETMEKKLFLINTAEAVTNVGAIPFFARGYGNYNQDYSDLNFMSWEGVDIPFFQCPNCMPDAQMINILLNAIKDEKPGMVIEIGDGSIAASLIDRMIPVLTVGLRPSTLEVSVTSFQTFSGSITDRERDIIAGCNIKENCIIEGVFSSGILKKTADISKKDLGFKENDFVVAIVGGRLDSDLTDEFLSELSKTESDNVKYALFGKCDTYSTIVERYPHLRDKMRYFGFVEDTRANLAGCDVYLNPVRRGGGTSAVEAMAEGIPVITLNYGDVAVNAGDDFCINALEEIGSAIMKYTMDREYYLSQSEKAVIRANYLQDSTHLFGEIINEYIIRRD